MTARLLPAPDDPPDRGETRPAILFVLPWQPDAAGGVNRVVLSLIEGFEQGTAYRPLLLVNRYPQRRVARITGRELPWFYEYFLPAPVDERRVARSLLSYLVRLPLTLSRFIALIRRDNVVTVNMHYPGLSAFTVLLARFITFGAFNVVLSFHGADLPRRRGGDLVQRLIWRFILRRADATVACSQALAEELRGIDSARGDALHVVHNAIDSAACRRKARQSALPPGLEGRRYLLSVGNFENKKAHDVLIESFDRIAMGHPDLCLAIVGGTGPTLAECQRRVAASPFRERVLLYRDLPHGSALAAIARATLFVLPSRREPFGMVILEAAALARPVVASSVGGIPEIIQNGYSGVLVPPDDVEALAEAFQSLLANPERSGAQAARLQETVRLKFTLTAQVRAYQDLFNASRGSTMAHRGGLHAEGGARPVGK